MCVPLLFLFQGVFLAVQDKYCIFLRYPKGQNPYPRLWSFDISSQVFLQLRLTLRNICGYIYLISENISAFRTLRSLPP